MNFILAGATGLVGSCFLHEAEQQSHSVVSVGRKSLDRGSNEILTDFADPVTLPPADVAICALGTTIARAGSREAFYAVDHDAVLTFATSAAMAGVERFIVVTAVGANSRARVFYSRVKGEIERDLQHLGFARLDIIQPGLLLGPRDEKRSVESILQTFDPLLRLAMRGPLDRYAGIDATTVARAMIALCEKTDPGVFRHENRALATLIK